MQPQNGRVTNGAYYQDYSMNPATPNIVRLEPVNPLTESQPLDVLPPILEPWQQWIHNQILPTLVRASDDRIEGRINYCLIVTCSQCCAVQLVPTYARIPPVHEMQQENEGRSNESQSCNGMESDRVPDENAGATALSPSICAGSKFTYLDPNAPEFRSDGCCPRKPMVHPRPVETEQYYAEMHAQNNENQWVQRDMRNERRPRKRGGRQNNQPRNPFQATRSRGYKSGQQFHQSQNQHEIPENANLPQMFRDTTLQMLNGPGAPYSLAPVPLAYCWTPEGAALQCMSASAGQFPPNGGQFPPNGGQLPPNGGQFPPNCGQLPANGGTFHYR